MRYGYPYQRQHGGQRRHGRRELPAPRPLTHLRPHFEHAAAAQPAQRNVAARLAPGDAQERILRVRRSSPVDGEQQIPGPQARLQSGTAEVQLLDQNARLREPELPRLLLRHVLGDDPDPAADHPAVGDDLGEYPRTMFTGIAKPMPSTPRFLATMAVLMPTSAPLESISAPPELPKLIGASVWMKIG